MPWTKQPAVKNPNFWKIDENCQKIDTLKNCLRQKLGLRQLNYVLFATKQVLTTKQSKIAEKSASIKVTEFATMPCLVKTVGTVTCRFNLWLFLMSTHFLVHSTGEFWFINNLSKLSCMVQDFRDRLMPPNWSSRKPLFTTKNDQT